MRDFIKNSVVACVLMAAVLCFSDAQAAATASNGGSASDRTMIASGAITAGDRVKPTTTTNTVAQAGATDDDAIGVALQTTATGATVDVKLFRRVEVFTANGAITAGANVYPAATGKVTATAGTTRRIGIALNATAADLDKCDVVLVDGYINPLPSTQLVSAGGGTGSGATAVRLTSLTTPGGIGADTTEDTMQTYTLPASTLSTAGQTVRVHATGTGISTANVTTLKMYFGSLAVQTFVLTASQANQWTIDMTVTKTGASTQWCDCKAMEGGTATKVGVASVTGAQTDTSGIVIKITGQEGTSGVANDIQCDTMLVYFDN